MAVAVVQVPDCQQRGDTLQAGFADADENAAREWHRELAGQSHRIQPQGGLLVR